MIVGADDPISACFLADELIKKKYSGNFTSSSIFFIYPLLIYGSLFLVSERGFIDHEKEKIMENDREVFYFDDLMSEEQRKYYE